MEDITIYDARRIITMDPNRPHATHVAVQSGRILAVGGPDCAESWGKPVRHDRRLADTVLMPGFVEGHAHLMAGGLWAHAYVGFHDRTDPDGRLWPGLTSIDAVVNRLTEYAERLDPHEPLIAWGFDPIFFAGERMNRHHLDRISRDRPIIVLFSSLHLLCANSATLDLACYGRETSVEGVIKDADNLPTGELQEMAAMFPVLRRLKLDFRDLSQTEEAIRAFGRMACRAGVTTITDLYSTMEDSDLDLLLRLTSEPDFPLRIVPVLGAGGAQASEIAARAKALETRSQDKLRLGAVKLMTDGSIQGWTARVKWPGYVGGQPNGLWNAAPDQIFELCEVMQREGVQMHIHVNGDEASELGIDALAAALRKHPGPELRHVLQHGQMMGADQFARCRELGIAVNLFANHLWYFGDQHAALTIGEDRARRMNGCRACLDAGVALAIHSDAPVTALGPLFTAWCAVNRRTASGRTLGPEQRISIAEALYAITLGAAHTLRLDGEVGSIETGKAADFAVLGEDPETVAPEALCNVPILGTVSGGVVHLP
ncbi:amidohydrolase [Fluviibacterium sp. DFM31]|uniref:Amidohydrolase n=1 Tax=Meridianimarinicoccus marinus TaxID=3231483 RepID=A0ABV3LBJ5_9RHOB